MKIRGVLYCVTAGLFFTLLALAALPARAATDAATDATADATTVALELVDNRMIVHATVNGHGPYAFVLDTGSSGTVLTPRVVAELGLHAADMTPQGGGVGEHLAPTGRVHIDEVRIGALRFGAETAIVTDLSEIERNIGFPHLDGILGYSVLEPLWTTVDVDHGRIVFTHRAPALPPNARTVRFYGEIPEVDGTVDGIATRVVVDTGDRSALTMFGAFATRHGYYRRHHALTHVLTGYGIGGPVYGDVFRLAKLTVFDTPLSDVVTRASRQRAGAFATLPQGGSIGGALLRRFNVVYDYPDKTITVWPSAQYANHDPYDKAGMWISASADGPVVRAVTPNGPAERAGIRSGETLLAVNGRPAAAWSVPDLRTLLATAPTGSRVRVTVRSATTSHEATIVLRDLI